MARLHQRQDSNKNNNNSANNQANAQAIDLIRRKFAAQNRAIAKSHASLEDKISQLEHITGQLMNENYDLKCENARLRKNQQKNGVNSEIKQQLREKWAEIEKLLTLNDDEGVEALVNTSITSEPGDQLVQLGTITKRKRKASDEDKKVEEHGYNDDVVDVNMLEDSIPEEEEVEDGECVKQIEYEAESEEVIMDNVIEEEEQEVVDEVVSDVPQVEEPAEVEVKNLEPEEKVDNEKDMAENNDTNNTNESIESKNEVTHVSNSILEPTLETPIKEPEQPTQASTEITEVSEQTTNKPTTKTNTSKNRKALSSKSTNSSTPQKKRTKQKGEKSPRKKQKTLPIENETMPQTIISNSPPRRRSSRGNQVNYALPSLRTKMRREKDNLVDAIDQEGENFTTGRRSSTRGSNRKSKTPVA